jgi:ribosome biogenesis GTPase A
MKDIKSLIPLMSGIKGNLSEREEELNAALKQLGIAPVRFSECLRVIEQQIKTANNKFTIAFVGEFKTGKSTIINSLLKLSGDARLSSEYDPDTAKCIRIMYKTDDIDYDAEIVYEDNTYENEKVDWTTAKKYTSQVALDENVHLKDRAEKISEVRYYLKEDILTVCNILDLPGTGTAHVQDHTATTDKKIFEADAIFWIVSTADEPGKEAIANLDKIKNKIIPVINVWQHEKEDIRGNFSAEQIVQFLNDRYATYFTDAEPPISYYAKEIDYAQTYGYEVKEEWGKEAFAQCLDRLVFSENVNLELDKINRMTKNIKNALEKLSASITENEVPLEVINDKVNHETLDIDLLNSQLYSVFQNAETKMADMAANTANEIISHIVGMTEAFIEDEMQDANLSMLIKAIGRNRKERLKNELKEKYECEYLKLDEEPCWYDEIMKEYLENIEILLNSEYARFQIEANKNRASMERSTLDSNFISSVIKQTVNSFLEKIGGLVGAVIAAIILAIIPGGAIIDAISLGILGNSKLNSDTMSKKKENVKNRARMSVSVQKYSVSNSLKEEARRINKDCKEKFLERINSRVSSNESKRNYYELAKSSIATIKDDIDTYIEQIYKFS